MSAPIPVIESIVRDVVATLAGVTRSSGYHIDLRPERRQVGGNSHQHGTAVVTLGSATAEEGPQQYTDWRQTINVTVTVVLNDALPYGLDTQLMVVAADVIRALCGGAADQATPRRDGWAIDTTPGETEIVESEAQSNVGVVRVSVSVHFRHNWGDPFTCPYRS